MSAAEDLRKFANGRQFATILADPPWQFQNKTGKVAPEHRRMGIARHLIEALQGEARSRGVHQIELDVWQFNESARTAYEHLGFAPIMQRMQLKFGTQEGRSASEG